MSLQSPPSEKFKQHYEIYLSIAQQIVHNTSNLIKIHTSHIISNDKKATSNVKEKTKKLFKQITQALCAIEMCYEMADKLILVADYNKNKSTNWQKFDKNKINIFKQLDENYNQIRDQFLNQLDRLRPLVDNKLLLKYYNKYITTYYESSEGVSKALMLQRQTFKQIFRAHMNKQLQKTNSYQPESKQDINDINENIQDQHKIALEKIINRWENSTITAEEALVEFNTLKYSFMCLNRSLIKPLDNANPAKKLYQHLAGRVKNIRKINKRLYEFNHCSGWWPWNRNIYGKLIDQIQDRNAMGDLSTYKLSVSNDPIEAKENKELSDNSNNNMMKESQNSQLINYKATKMTLMSQTQQKVGIITVWRLISQGRFRNIEKVAYDQDCINALIFIATLVSDSNLADDDEHMNNNTKENKKSQIKSLDAHKGNKKGKIESLSLDVHAGIKDIEGAIIKIRRQKSNNNSDTVSIENLEQRVSGLLSTAGTISKFGYRFICTHSATKSLAEEGERVTQNKGL